MKYDKYIKSYAMATNGIISMLLLGGIGFFIGYKIDKSSPWPAILAVVGVICGLFIFISNLLYVLKLNEKEKKQDGKHEG